MRLSVRNPHNHHPHLKNCLSKVIICIFALPKPLKAEIAEVRKVDQTLPEKEYYMRDDETV